MKSITLVFMGSILLTSAAFGQKVVQQSEDIRTKQGHFSVGIGGGFGFAKERDGDESGIVAGGFLEPSYTMMLDPWSIGEFSLEVGSGKIDYESGNQDVEIGLNYMAMLQAGYGYSLGDNLFTIFKVGAGPASADFEAGGVKSDGSTTGIALRLSAGLRMLAAQAIDFGVGLRGTYVTFDFDLNGGGSADAKLLLSELYLSARIKI